MAVVQRIQIDVKCLHRSLAALERWYTQDGHIIEYDGHMNEYDVIFKTFVTDIKNIAFHLGVSITHNDDFAECKEYFKKDEQLRRLHNEVTVLLNETKFDDELNQNQLSNQQMQSEPVKLLIDRVHVLNQSNNINTKAEELLNENQHIHVKRLETKVEAAENEAKKLIKQISSQKDQLFKVAKEHNEAKETVKTLQVKNCKLIETISVLELNKKSLNEEIEQYSQRVTYLENKLDLIQKERNDERKMHETKVGEFEEKLSHKTQLVLENEMKAQEIDKRTKKDIQENEFKMSEINDKLHKTLKELTDIKAYTQGKEEESLRTKLTEHELELDQHNQHICHLNDLLKDSELKAEELDRKNKILETTANDINKENKNLRKEQQHLQGEIEYQHKRITDLETQLQVAAEESIREKRIEKERKDQLRDQLHATEAELEDTKTRLSKSMGLKLTDSNPNVTDLSDRHRPTKLAEKYAELYDNQWTDAFDVLDKTFPSEEKIINILLNILLDVMRFCKEKATEQMKLLTQHLQFTDTNIKGDNSTDFMKLVKDCRKAAATTAMVNLKKIYQLYLTQSANETLKTALDVEAFTSECLEVCWFMAVQDPPVAFAALLTNGSSFETELYKPYTISGTHVEYVVWPPLVLHENGPILAKGIAQGCGKKL